MDRCRTGQKNDRNQLLRKRSEIWASSDLLLEPFTDLLCKGNHEHGQVAGSDTKPSQLYTWQFAERVVLGCQTLLAAKYGSTKPKLPITAFAYPSVGSDASDPPAPEGEPPAGSGASSSSSAPIMEPWRHCWACRGRRRADHYRHTRIRGQCKYPDHESKIWDCPGCKAEAPRHDLRHVLDDRCQWSVTAYRHKGPERMNPESQSAPSPLPTSASQT